MSNKKIPLTIDLIRRFVEGRVFQDNSANVNAINFSQDGKYLVTSSNDESIHLYDCEKGELKKMCWSKKYGVAAIKFTHHNEAVICASNNDHDQTIRYLSLHDNRYLRYFKGHRERVVSIAMSPRDDSFVSGAVDGTVRFWKLQSNVCLGKLVVRSSPSVAYDSEGKIIAVACMNIVYLYNIETFDKGPFDTFYVEGDAFSVEDLRFSPSGQDILIATSEGMILISARDGSVKHELKGNGDLCGSCSFSPDGKFIARGTKHGQVHIWDSFNGELVHTLSGHSGKVLCAEWNPQYMMLVTACNNLAFWVPK